MKHPNEHIYILTKSHPLDTEAGLIRSKLQMLERQVGGLKQISAGRNINNLSITKKEKQIVAMKSRLSELLGVEV